MPAAFNVKELSPGAHLATEADKAEALDIIQTWKASPATQAEFNFDYSTYLAFRMAQDRGQVKVLGQQEQG